MEQQELFPAAVTGELPMTPLSGSFSKPLQVCYGGGVNSTAMLIGLERHGIRPDLITFADTGGEKPETYAYLDVIQCWLSNHNFPALQVVRRKPWPQESTGKGATTLEEYCLATGALPSIVYGWKTCSEQWKGRAQEAFVAATPEAMACWRAHGKVCQARGYHADEPQRAKHPEKTRYSFWYPLIEWDWGQAECEEAIRQAGLPVPPKSACFFCPSSTKNEVLKLHQEYPDLFGRAVAMERALFGYNERVKGLGRRWSWEGLVSLPLLEQAKLCDPSGELPCECFDGSGE